MKTSDAIESGTIIGGRYRIVDRIGEGAMGTVFRVEHTEMATPMAIKLLKTELLEIPGIAERFNLEARSVARLDHPHILRVTDFGRTDTGQLFMVMELLTGRSLRQRLYDGRIPLAQAIEVTRQILAGLHYAHAEGIVHRDLKPDNIVLVQRQQAFFVKIVDFGLVKMLTPGASDAGLTQPGTVFGTPRYMSPEQSSGDVVDHRSDIYSAGVILFEMLCGCVPFDGDDVASILMKHISQPPPPLKHCAADPVSREKLQAVVHTALAKQPSARFSSAQDFMAALALNAPLPKKPILNFKKLRLRWPLVWVGVFVALLFVGMSLWPRPSVTPNAALEPLIQSGQFDRAAQLVSAWISSEPEKAAPRLMLGHIHYWQGRKKDALSAYAKALALEQEAADDTRLTTHLRELLATKSADSAEIITSLALFDSKSRATLLAEYAQSARDPRLRRQAYEALEKHDETDILDTFSYLSSQLKQNTSDSCEIRKWYVTRVIALEDEQSLPLLRQELNRRGGFLNLSRTADCMRKELNAAIQNLSE